MAELGRLDSRRHDKLQVRVLLIVTGLGVRIGQREVDSKPVEMQVPRGGRPHFRPPGICAFAMIVACAEMTVFRPLIVIAFSQANRDVWVVVVNPPVARQLVSMTQSRRRNGQHGQQCCQQRTDRAKEEAGKHGIQTLKRELPRKRNALCK